MRKFLGKKYTKIALVLSVAMIFIWIALGTGTSLAWFTDVTPVDRNVLNVGVLEVEVDYLNENGEWKSIEAVTDVFDDEALYEPGYTQVVKLRVRNIGNVPFDYKTAVTVFDYDDGVNVFGARFNLQDYLKFGVVDSDSIAELEQKLEDRNAARDEAVMGLPLNTYSTKPLELLAGDTAYVALIVYMPETVGNIANHAIEQPSIALGINVKATQQGAIE